MTRVVRRIWKGSGRILNADLNAKVKHALGLIVFAFAMFGLITVQIHTLEQATRERDLREALWNAYLADLRSYDIAVIQHDQCLRGLDSRELNRTRFTSLAEMVGRVVDVIGINVSEEAQPIVDDMRDEVAQELDNIETDLPSLPRSTCAARPPVPPTPPQR